jgi:hypothetical protein
MSFEIDSLDTEDYLDCAHWMQSVGLWDGHHVTVEEAPTFQKVLEDRLTAWFYSLNSYSPEFQQLGAMLARLGTTTEKQALLARDIQALRIFPDGTIALVDLGKQSVNFGRSIKQKSSSVLVS